jgi:hypothetical protein
VIISKEKKITRKTKENENFNDSHGRQRRRREEEKINNPRYRVNGYNMRRRRKEGKKRRKENTHMCTYNMYTRTTSAHVCDVRVLSNKYQY